MKLIPRSLTGQIAALIAVALFVAQAINLALLFSERRELRFEQATRPSVVRLVDAAERLAGNRALLGDDRPYRGGRVRLLPVNPIDPRLERSAEVEAALTRALDEAGMKHGRIVTGIQDIRRDDPRLGRLPAGKARRFARGNGELMIAVEQGGRGWLVLSARWPRQGGQIIARLIGQTLILYAIVLLPMLWIARRIAPSSSGVFTLRS
ncbi:MAG: two-component sensor histidine kinase, partial [Pseudomonadota bacterium]